MIYNILAINTGKKAEPDSIIPVERFRHMSHMMLENCGASIKWFIKSEKQFPEECAGERVVMGQECIKWIEEVW